MNPNRPRKPRPTKRTPAELERERVERDAFDLAVYLDDALAFVYCDPYITSLFGEPVL